MAVRDGVPPKSAFITVDGRRWRTSDPRIPEPLRQELVNELMARARLVAPATIRCDQPGASTRRFERYSGAEGRRRGECFCQLFAIARSRWPGAANSRLFVAVGL